MCFMTLTNLTKVQRIVIVKGRSTGKYTEGMSCTRILAVAVADPCGKI